MDRIRVLVNILHDMELNRPLYYFTVSGMVIALVGIGLGLNFLREFYLGQTLRFGPTLLMIMLTLVGMYMAFTGIIHRVHLRYLLRNYWFLG